jgi:hypothetical protein
MKSHLKVIVFAALALNLATSAAHAADTTCLEPLKGTSGMQQSLTSATDGVTAAQIKRSYAKAFKAGRAEAIAEWQGKVLKACPDRTTSWLRANTKTVEACEQAMGGRFSVCISAIPGRSWRGR